MNYKDDSGCSKPENNDKGSYVSIPTRETGKKKRKKQPRLFQQIDGIPSLNEFCTNLGEMENPEKYHGLVKEENHCDEKEDAFPNDNILEILAMKCFFEGKSIRDLTPKYKNYIDKCEKRFNKKIRTPAPSFEEEPPEKEPEVCDTKEEFHMEQLPLPGSPTFSSDNTKESKETLNLVKKQEDLEYLESSGTSSLYYQKDEDGITKSVQMKKKSKRGRPEKVINLTDQDLIDYLKSNISSQAAEICEDQRYEFRADTLRVRLMRLAKKLPLNMLHKLHSKSKYKSVNVEHYKSSFLNTFVRFFRVIKLLGLEINQDWDKFGKTEKDPPEFIQFCSLHFPRTKCENLFSVGMEKEIMTQLLVQRGRTSLKAFMEFGKINRVFFTCIKLMYKLGQECFNEKAKVIIKNFIKAEMEMYPDRYYPKEIIAIARE